MMRSMFSGVSGLRAHQTRMDVIGNNIANVNTIGFKSGRVTFQEIFSQTLRGAGAPDMATGRGGTNPMQVGLGLGVGAIDTIMTRGSVQRTDNPTDLSIEGDGYFIVKGGKTGAFMFTRAGNFGIDKLGNLVTGSGMNVYGWMKYDWADDGTPVFDTEMDIEPINLFTDAYNLNKRIIAAKATTTAVLAGNLDASEPLVADTSGTPQFSVPITIYDSLGNDYQVKINFWKTDADPGNSTTWTWEIDGGAGATATATGTITFDTKGKIMNANPAIPIDVTFSPTSTDTGIADFTVSFDFSKITMYAADSSVKPTYVDGYTTGNLVTFNIGSDGIITGIYSNGQQQPLGMIALAGFDNPAGLQKVGENLFITTTNSGDFKKGLKAGSEGVGTLSPGTLEMSNVDLSREFTDMIVTQRGFQANSRIITTSDEMLQELVNLKR